MREALARLAAPHWAHKGSRSRQPSAALVRCLVLAWLGQARGQFTPGDKNDLWSALMSWNTNASAGMTAYGPVGTWDVTAVTDFFELFKDLAFIDEDLVGWDTCACAPFPVDCTLLSWFTE